MSADRPPGRPALELRVGDYASFRATMLAALDQVRVQPPDLHQPEQPLADLHRDSADSWVLALIDAWAMVGDILTFYQERYGNEGYLGTAQEQLSIELLLRSLGVRRGSGSHDAPPAAASCPAAARTSPAALAPRVELDDRAPGLPERLTPAGPSMGGSVTAEALPLTARRPRPYRFRIDPGAAAIADVRFRVVPSRGQVEIARIPAGTAIRSHPTDGGLPTVFETASALDARLEWNAIAAAKTRQQRAATIVGDSIAIAVAGTKLAIKPGAELLIVGTPQRRDAAAPDPSAAGETRPRSWVAAVVETVEARPALGHTLLTWVPGTLAGAETLGEDWQLSELAIYRFTRTARPFGHDAVAFAHAAAALRIPAALAGGVRTRPGQPTEQGEPAEPVEQGAEHWRSLDEELPSGTIRALAVDDHGALWLGGSRGVFRRPAGETGAWAAVSAGLKGGEIVSLTRSDDGRIWAGTATGRVFFCHDPTRGWTELAGGYVLVESDKKLAPVKTALPRSPVVAVASYVPAEASEVATTEEPPATTRGERFVDRVREEAEELVHWFHRSRAPLQHTVLVATGLGAFAATFDGRGWFGDNDQLAPLAALDGDAPSGPTLGRSLVALAVLPARASGDVDPDPNQSYAVAATRSGFMAYAWSPLDPPRPPVADPPKRAPAITDDAGVDLPPRGHAYALAGIRALALVEGRFVAHGPPVTRLVVVAKAGPRLFESGELLELGAGLAEAELRDLAAVPLAAQGSLGVAAVASDGAHIWGLEASERRWRRLDRDAEDAPDTHDAETGGKGVPDLLPRVAVGPEGTLLAAAALRFPSEWPNFTVLRRDPDRPTRQIIDLDAKPFDLAPGGRVLAREADGRLAAFTVHEATAAFRRRDSFGQPGPVYRLTVEALESPAAGLGPRSTTVALRSESLTPAQLRPLAGARFSDLTLGPQPTERYCGGDKLILDGLVADLAEDDQRPRENHERKPLAITGQRLRLAVALTGGLWSLVEPIGARYLALGFRTLTALLEVDGQLWVGTGKRGVYHRRGRGPWLATAGLRGEAAKIAALLRHGSHIYAATGAGLWLRTIADEDSPWTRAVADDHPLAGAAIAALAVAGEGDDARLFVASGIGLWSGPLTGELSRAADVPAKLAVTALTVDDEHRVIVAGVGAVYRSSQAGFEALPDSGHRVTCLMSLAGLLIAGTVDHGVVVLDPEREQARWQPANTGLDARHITTLVPVPGLDGTPEPRSLLLGSAGQGVYHGSLEHDSGDDSGRNSGRNSGLNAEQGSELAQLRWRAHSLGTADEVRALLPLVEHGRRETLVGTAAQVSLVDPTSGRAVDRFVFSLALELPRGLGFARELDHGWLTARLRARFEQAHQPLPKDAEVAVLHAGGHWLLASASDPDAPIYLLIADPIAGIEVLRPDDLPMLTAAPTPIGGALYRWQVHSRTGERGVLHAEPSQLLPRPPRSGDPTVAEVHRVVQARYLRELGTTQVELDGELAHYLWRDSVEVSANVVRASEGETVRDEAIGSGDPSQANQVFQLRRAGLVFLPAPPPIYRRSSLRVRVDGIAWSEVANLSEAGPDARVYTLHVDHQGHATLRFGDGRRGARLPAGNQNVRASYRVRGPGPMRVSAGSLDVLLAPPPGVAAVTNPVPASAAITPESSASMRRRAPQVAPTLDRAVSLRDYERVALGLPGIESAAAQRFGRRRSPSVRVTVDFALDLDESARASSLAALRETLAAAQLRPGPRLLVAAARQAEFRLSARVWLAAGYGTAEVAPAILTALRERWRLRAAAIGESIAPNAIEATIQTVDGVAGAQCTALHPSGDPAGERKVLIAAPATLEHPAQRLRLAGVRTALDGLDHEHWVRAGGVTLELLSADDRRSLSPVPADASLDRSLKAKASVPREVLS